jgi:hypothetical protein
MNDEEKARLFDLLQRLVAATEAIATTLEPVTGETDYGKKWTCTVSQSLDRIGDLLASRE